MDYQRDYEPFKRLVMRLSTTFDKFATDELIESWWKALRTADLGEIERRVDAFIARATDATKFPRPGSFQPKDAPIFDPKDEARERRLSEENAANWREFIKRFPITGPLRLRLAQCARIVASERESSPAHAEALAEERWIENQLGGRYAADR
jgi:hypothetical protein